jgi:molecular chaperone GrpE (heat shock protein)
LEGRIMPDFEQREKIEVATLVGASESVRNANSATDSGAGEGPGGENAFLEKHSPVSIPAVPEIIETTTSTDLQGSQEVTARLGELEAAIATGFEQVLKSFEQKLAFDQFKEDQISRLHNELQEYKGGLIAKTARPLINGIIRFHDDVGRIVEALQKCNIAELTPDRFFKVIQGFLQDIEIVLRDNGVEAYSEAGDTFDPHRQKALTTIPSTDSAIAGRIAARLRPGFEQGGIVLQKERVAVYVLANPAAQSNDDSEATRIQKSIMEGGHK